MKIYIIKTQGNTFSLISIFKKRKHELFLLLFLVKIADF
jgi:hypothetical protein